MINAVLFGMSDPNVERGPERYFATCCVIVRQLDQQRRVLRPGRSSDRIGNGNTSWNSSHAHDRLQPGGPGQLGWRRIVLLFRGQLITNQLQQFSWEQAWRGDV
jgi:hypothetical protein